MKHLGPTMSTTYIYLVPAITATASVLILGEPMNLPIVAGVAMTIGGLILSQGRSADPDDSAGMTQDGDNVIKQRFTSS